MIVLDTKTIQKIHLFHRITGVLPIDCVENEVTIYYLVPNGFYGFAVGKKGVKVLKAEKVFKKQIKVFEYTKDLETFLKNLIPEAKEITIKDNKVLIKVSKFNKPKIIGKHGLHIKAISLILKRHFNIKNIEIR